MRAKKVTSLKEYIEILEESKKRDGGFVNLHEVLNALMDLDVRDEANAELRYSSTHIVPSRTFNDLERTALIEYNDIENELESNSYVISFIDVKKFAWSVLASANFFVWTK